jgi:hypothetical protein
MSPEPNQSGKEDKERGGRGWVGEKRVKRQAGRAGKNGSINRDSSANIQNRRVGGVGSAREPLGPCARASQCENDEPRTVSPRAKTLLS